MIVDNTDEERQALNEESTSVLQLKASFEALRIEFQSLRAHVDNTNNELRPTSTSSAVNQKSETDADLLYILPSDTLTSCRTVFVTASIFLQCKKHWCETNLKIWIFGSLYLI
jgi:hypothetical protein